MQGAILDQVTVTVHIWWKGRRIGNATKAMLPGASMWPEHDLWEAAHDAGRRLAIALWSVLGGPGMYRRGASEVFEVARADLWLAARDQRVDNLALFEQSWPGFTAWAREAVELAGCPSWQDWSGHVMDGFWGHIYTRPNPLAGWLRVRDGRHRRILAAARAVRPVSGPRQSIVSVDVVEPAAGATAPVSGGFRPDDGPGGVDGRQVDPVLR